ncbi:TspO/MBR family protein [Chloroflexota bacterium]
MKWQDIAKLIGSILACEGAGAIGSIFTTPAIPTWYATLEKPAFTPPNSVFAPVWLTLYLLMGIAVFLVWRRGLRESGGKRAFALFWGQLVVNMLWSVVFFGLKSPLAGVVVIVILWLAILFTIIRFFRVSEPAGWLLTPYILWVSIASYLNIGVWLLNS